MAKILIWEESLWGSPPWREVNATCLVNETHSMTSIVTWLRAKCDKYKGKEIVYVAAHGNHGTVFLGKDRLDDDTVGLWASLHGKLRMIVLLACSVAGGQTGRLFCRRLARITGAFVIAALTEQTYYPFPFGILPSTFGDWEGTVEMWGPDGKWAGPIKVD
jgi:hypothetical protein